MFCLQGKLYFCDRLSSNDDGVMVVLFVVLSLFDFLFACTFADYYVLYGIVPLTI